MLAPPAGDHGAEPAAAILSPSLGIGLRRKTLAGPASDSDAVASRRTTRSRRAEEDSDDGYDAVAAVAEACGKPAKVGRLVPDAPVCYETIRAREAVRRQAMVRPLALQNPVSRFRQSPLTALCVLAAPRRERHPCRSSGHCPET